MSHLQLILLRDKVAGVRSVLLPYLDPSKLQWAAHSVFLTGLTAHPLRVGVPVPASYHFMWKCNCHSVEWSSAAVCQKSIHCTYTVAEKHWAICYCQSKKVPVVSHGGNSNILRCSRFLNDDYIITNFCRV